MLTLHAHALRDWLTCSRLVWLNTHGDLAARAHWSGAQQIAFARGRDHEDAMLHSAAPYLEKVMVESWEDAVLLTQAALRDGVEKLAGGALEAVMHLDGHALRLRGKIDWLIRYRRSYTPVEIKTYTTLTEADRLQLDVYCWLLHVTTNREPLRAEFWLGNGDDAVIVEHEYDPERLYAVIRQMLPTLIDAHTTPPVVLLPHCKTCRWKEQCYRHEDAQDNIARLSLTQKTVAHLRGQGITTIQQFAAHTPDELRRYKGIKTTANRLHAQAHAYLKQQMVLFAPIHPDVGLPCAMFDIETDPTAFGRPRVWSIGYGMAEESVRVVMVAPHRLTSGVAITLSLPDGNSVTLVNDMDTLWRTFAQDVQSHARAFHWSAFDATVMRQTAPADVLEIMLPRVADLLKHTRDAVAFPLDSYSLKPVGRLLGFSWSAYDGWDAAWRDYQRYGLAGDLDALAQACAYQRDDVRAMFVVQRAITQL